MREPSLRGVFFDVGDTLLAPYPSFLELFALIMEDAGHRVSPNEVEAALQEVGPDIAAIVARTSGEEKWSTSTEKSRAFWRRLYGAMLDHWAIPDPDGDIFDLLYRRFTSYESYRLFPDVLPALRACRDAGLLLAVVSNFESWLEGMLIEFEVAPFFSCMVISGTEGVEKPDPAIFRLALDRCGLAPAEVAFVGDHPEVDVAAAKQLGMTGILVDRHGRYPDHPAPRITDLIGLLPILGLRTPA